MPKATLIHAVGKSYTSIFDELQSLVPTPPVRMLAQGDSWYSLFVNTTDMLGGTNMLWHVDTPRPAVIINLASTGNALQDMAEAPQIETFSALLNRRYGYAFDAILLSGGGNDALAKLASLIRQPAGACRGPEDCLDEAAVIACFDALRSHLLTLVRARDDSQLNRSTPIVIHTYDYVAPRDLPFQFFVVSRGPWAWRALMDAGITDPAVQKAITDYLLELWANLLLELQASGVADRFFVANTLGTLTPAAATDLTPGGDWHDEIHPTAAGFGKLAAAELNPLLDTLLPGATP